jgi:hypothetical protein
MQELNATKKDFLPSDIPTIREKFPTKEGQCNEIFRQTTQSGTLFVNFVVNTTLPVFVSCSDLIVEHPILELDLAVLQ